DWGKLFESIANNSLTVTVLTGLVSIIVVKMQKNNKKQEIDYLNEAEIKIDVRKLATEIVTNANEIAVGVNTYIDMLDKMIMLKNGREIIQKDSKHANKEIAATTKNKINQINLNSSKIITSMVQFELYFVDAKHEHESVIKVEELHQKTVDLKLLLFEIQENFNEENLNNIKKRLEITNGELNKQIEEFSLSVRKTLRLYLYKLHGKPRLSDRVKYYTPKWICKLKQMIDRFPFNISSFFLGLICGLCTGLFIWFVVGLIIGKYLTIIAGLFFLLGILIHYKKSNT
ncbi:hypothetical protein PMV44_16685, partial [Enterococcus casseliflavus]|uniref:hypothetical protein n=1 Tax=Enterococcus casseliflavus TaxID=37734 RepID=UPI00232EBB71